MTSSTFVDRETHRVVDPPPTVLLLVAVDPPPPRRLAASTLLPVGRSPSSLARTLAAVVGLSPSSGGPVGGWAPSSLLRLGWPPVAAGSPEHDGLSAQVEPGALASGELSAPPEPWVAV
jgi:hypothetical protein